MYETFDQADPNISVDLVLKISMFIDFLELFFRGTDAHALEIVAGKEGP